MTKTGWGHLSIGEWGVGVKKSQNGCEMLTLFNTQMEKVLKILTLFLQGDGELTPQYPLTQEGIHNREGLERGQGGNETYENS